MNSSIDLAVDCSRLKASVAISGLVANEQDQRGDEQKVSQIVKTEEREDRLENFLPRAFQDLVFTGQHTIESINKAFLLDGPGSFTGLRSQIAFLKGLFFERDLPVCAISGFELLFYLGKEKKLTGDYLLIPAFDRLGYYIHLVSFEQNIWVNDGSAGYTKDLGSYDRYPILWGVDSPSRRPQDSAVHISAERLLQIRHLLEERVQSLEQIQPNYYKKHYAEI